MGKKVLTFGNIKIGKDNFPAMKAVFFKEDVNIENVLVSNKISLGKKL